jgi:hypothetical protein
MESKMAETEPEYRHPMRDAEIHVFKRVDAEDSYVARFAPYETYPIIFTGGTVDDVTAKAEAFRMEAVEKYEHGYNIKRRNIAIAQEARQKRNEAAGRAGKAKVRKQKV